eukprot:5971955-Alexandrium_andersonii.AAC.1
MPTSNKDSETAPLYKQLLRRPLAVKASGGPEDVRLLDDFQSLSHVPGDYHLEKHIRGQTAFTRSWLEYAT